jgi:hypothetical protein
VGTAVPNATAGDHLGYVQVRKGEILTGLFERQVRGVVRFIKR